MCMQMPDKIYMLQKYAQFTFRRQFNEIRCQLRDLSGRC